MENNKKPENSNEKNIQLYDIYTRKEIKSKIVDKNSDINSNKFKKLKKKQSKTFQKSDIAKINVNKKSIRKSKSKTIKENQIENQIENENKNQIEIEK